MLQVQAMSLNLNTSNINHDICFPITYISSPTIIIIIIIIIISHFFPMARQPLGGLGLLIFRGFAITHFRHTTLGRTPLDE
jgi:hypothetical protein